MPGEMTQWVRHLPPDLPSEIVPQKQHGDRRETAPAGVP